MAWRTMASTNAPCLSDPFRYLAIFECGNLSASLRGEGKSHGPGGPTTNHANIVKLDPIPISLLAFAPSCEEIIYL